MVRRHIKSISSDTGGGVPLEAASPCGVDGFTDGARGIGGVGGSTDGAGGMSCNEVSSRQYTFIGLCTSHM